ncbi:MAG TPA: hypothetical protein VE055_02805 [Gaiellaceae bacterium]|nr:hypothetical protein [Gaiellaceae bacterium]
MARPEDDRRCPRCSTPYSEGQEYCLECGNKLPARPGLIARLGKGWRRRAGWYPGDWIWPALLALVVAIVAGVVSAVWLADDSSSANDTLVRTQAGPSTSVPTQTAPEPTTTVPTTTTTTTGTTAPPPPPPPKPALVAWPATKNGWTIVLDSVPTINGRAGAVGEGKQALGLGLKPVGVLDSGGFSSLHPGYFVVFFGIYGSEAEAQSHVIEAHRRGYRAPYPRRITP